jgi:hypothetical protein
MVGFGSSTLVRGRLRIRQRVACVHPSRLACIVGLRPAETVTEESLQPELHRGDQ